MRINLAKSALLLGAILIFLRLLSPPELPWRKGMSSSEDYPDYPAAFAQSLGIGIVTGVLYFVLQKKKDGK